MSGLHDIGGFFGQTLLAGAPDRLVWSGSHFHLASDYARGVAPGKLFCPFRSRRFLRLVDPGRRGVAAWFTDWRFEISEGGDVDVFVLWRKGEETKCPSDGGAAIAAGVPACSSLPVLCRHRTRPHGACRAWCVPACLWVSKGMTEARTNQTKA